MHPRTEERYLALFYAYGSGGSLFKARQGGETLVLWAKDLISRALELEVVRADAALFMLVNFDQMIIHPYFGYVPGAHGEPLPPFREYEPAIAETTVQQMIKIILREIPKDERPASAKFVMKFVSENLENILEEVEERFDWPPYVD